MSEPPALWGISGSHRHQVAMKHYRVMRTTAPNNPQRSQRDGVVFQYSFRSEIHFRHNGDERVVPVYHAYIFESFIEPRWVPPAKLPYECLWIRFTGAGLAEHWRMLRDRHGPVIAIPPQHHILRAANRLIENHQRDANTPAEASAIHSFVMSLYAHGESHRQKTLTPAQRAVQHLMQQPCAPHALKEVARSFDITREHLTRVFIETTGTSPAAWLRAQRFEHACQLLLSTDLAIAEVAEQSGFSSSGAFARLARETHGLSPSQLREQLQGV